MVGFVQGLPMNYCSVCGLAFQFNDALVDHIFLEHSPYSTAPYSPQIIRATNQQIADDTIDNMFQNPKHRTTTATTNIQQDAVIPHQVERTEYQHNLDNPMNRAVTVETPNPHLQIMAEMNLRYSNTAFSNTTSVQSRLDDWNARASPRGNADGNTGQFHPNSRYQQEPTPNRMNLQVPYNPQYTPATNPENQNNTLKDSEELRKMLIQKRRTLIDEQMQQNSYQNTYSASTGAQSTNLAGNTSQTQPRPALKGYQKCRNNVRIIKNMPGGIVMYRCKRCGRESNKRSDIVKHKNEHHKDVKRYEQVIQTITYFTPSQQNYTPIPETIRMGYPQRNPELILPQAPPKIMSITIDDDEPELQNHSHIHSLQTTSENGPNNHPQHSQQHNDQNERAEVKHTNLLSIRNPTEVNNLIFKSQHEKPYEDGNTSNTINNFKENSKPKSLKRNNSHLVPESIASNAHDRWENTNNNNNTHSNMESLYMHELLDLYDHKRVKVTNVTSSSDYDASKNYDGQNNNTIKAIESEQKGSEKKNERLDFYSEIVTLDIDDASNSKSVAAEIQQNKSEGTSSSITIEGTDSAKEDDASDSDIERNKSIEQQSKTRKEVQSSSAHEECMLLNSSDFPIDKNNMFSMVKNYVSELLLPTLNNLKDTSQNVPKLKLFKCKTCPKLFVEEKQLHKHLDKKCSNRRGKICKKCHLEFSKKSMKKHVKEHHNSKNNLTSEDFNIVTGLNSTSSDSSESSTSSDSSEESDNVSTSSSPNSTLKLHEPIGERQVEQSNGHQNPESLKDYTKLLTSIENIEKILTPDNEKPNARSSHKSFILKCPKCKERFHQKSFARHKEVCGKNKIKKCDVRPIKFSTKSSEKHKKEDHSSTSKHKNNVRDVHNDRADSKSVSKITNTQKGKFYIPRKLLDTVYQSYSNTLFKCGKCNVCFATIHTLQSHVNKNNHEMSTVKKCPTCNLLFSRISLERHHDFHHKHLNLKEKTDFILKVRHISRVKPRITKNIVNSKKPFISTKNYKKSLTDSKGNTSSSLQKKKETSRKIEQYRRARDEQKKRTPEIPKNKTKQDRFNTEVYLKDVNTFHNCSQCDILFMENTCFQKHLAVNHKLLIEPLFCTFCKHSFCVSPDSFKLHIAAEFDNLQKNTKTPINIIQTSPVELNDDRNNVKLKECVVTINKIQSSLVSTTSTNQNSGRQADEVGKVNLKKALDSKNNTGHSDYSFPSLTTDDHKDSHLSEELGNNAYLTDNRNYHENKPHMMNVDTRTKNIQLLDNYALVETTPVSEKDDLFTTENTFEENLTNEHVEIREFDFGNDIQETANDKIDNDHNQEERNAVIMSNSTQKSIKNVSNIVLKDSTRKDDKQPETCDKTQSKNLLQGNAVDKNCVLVSSTDTNQVYDTQEQTPFIIGDTNLINDDNDNVPDFHEKCELISEKHHSIHESAENIITEGNRLKENFTTGKEDSSNFLSILASSHITEYASKPKNCYQNKPIFDFDPIGDVNSDPKGEEVSEAGPKLNRTMSKSTEDLIKLLEDNLNEVTTKPDEEQQNPKLEIPLNENTFVTKDTVTVPKHDNVVVATNKIGITKSNLDITSSILTEGFETSELNETYNMDKDLTKVLEKKPEIVTIDDDELVENEQINETISPFLDDFYEMNTENNSNDVNERKLEPIKIKLHEKIVTIDDDEPVEEEQINETISPFLDDFYEINTENNSKDVNERKLERKPIKIKLPTEKITTRPSFNLDLLELD